MKKWLFLLLILFVGYLFFAPPPPSLSSELYTDVERHVVAKEDELTPWQHVLRFVYFRQAVKAALAQRVKEGEYVPYDDIAPVMRQAMVAAEDRRFYVHGALDLIGVGRALYTNVLAGHTVEGGSTLTQQLVKNLFLTEHRTMARKIEEALLAYRMEATYSKKEILAMYLNCVYFGNHYYGIKEAAEGYYGVAPKDLNLPQAALIAGLPQAPTYYNPYENPNGAVARRNTVLHLMVSQGLITAQEADGVMQAPIVK